MRPVSARPVPVRVSGAGVPEVLEESVTDAVWGPGAEGVNCTPSQQLVQVPVKVVRKAEVGGWPWPKPVSSTRMALKSGAEVVAVRVGKGEVILYHSTEGWPTMTVPKARVLLPVLRIGVPVPLSETKVGEEELPVVMERRPWRVPGCDGAKVMRTVQVELSGRVTEQSVVSVKSPVRVRESGKATA